MPEDIRTYPARPIVGIGVVVLREDAVLLVRRGQAPALGAWSLPGGAQMLGETAEAGARRELREETALQVGSLHLAGCVDSIHTDASCRIEYHYTILDFCAVYAGGQAIAGGDAVDVAWASLERLEEFDLWDEARRIIELSQQILSGSGR